jgi:glutamate racemase
MIGPGAAPKFLTTGDPSTVSNHATRFMRRKVTFEKA